MHEARSLLIIRNPHARTAPSERELLEASAPLSRAGWDIEVHSTDAPHHAESLAREAARRGVGIVVACGGDGTVREVVAGLVGTDAALGVIRGGTANVWAREAGVPSGPRAALAAMLRTSRHRVDTGLVSLDGGAPERFLLMCSAGIDAAVLGEVEARGHKAGWGRAAFAWPAARALGSAPAIDAFVSVEGAPALRRRLLLLVAGNSRLYGGLLRLTPEALIDDGRLDVCAFSTDGGGPRRGVLVGSALLRGFTRRWGDAPGIDTARGASMTVEAEAPLAVQVDGEYLGVARRLEVEVSAASLVVLLGARGRELLGG